jgi:hypothetical protein
MILPEKVPVDAETQAKMSVRQQQTMNHRFPWQQREFHYG